MNEERVEKLEKGLSNYLFKRRIISGILFVAFLILGLVFTFIREATREVVVHGEGLFSYETVTYNYDYDIGIIIGFITATVIGCYFFVDLIFCRFQTTEANGHYITVYRGMVKCAVYINGEEKVTDGMYVVDTKLPDGTKISVSFSRGAFMIAHISFSDNNPSIDL